MSELSAADQALIYSVALYGVLMLFIVWECVAPRRRLTRTTWIRWLNNGALWWLDATVQRGVVAGLLASAGSLAEARGWGLFNNLALPEPIEAVAVFLLLDFSFYARHVLFHRVPLLWRFHVVHHSDLECDVTTSLRFHPLDFLFDTILSTLIVMGVGGSPLVVFVYLAIAMATNSLRHANAFLPHRVERLLGMVLVTHSFHRVHHSAVRQETDSNFGVVFPWWDRLLNTCVERSNEEHDAMRIGLEYFREPREAWLPGILMQPFRCPWPGSASERAPGGDMLAGPLGQQGNEG